VSQAEDALALQLRALRIGGWIREHRFCARRWRFDFAWPAQKLALEIDGAVWVQGRHTRGVGVEADNVKLAAAVIQGWRVLRVTPGQVQKGLAVAWVQQALEP
jgi:very-short-patch-repair endonuclease